jgi:hypothetical protein
MTFTKKEGNMKRAGLILAICLLAGVAFGQEIDPMAFQTWDVVYFDYNFQSEGAFCIIDVENPDKRAPIRCATIILLVDRINPDRQEGVLIGYSYVEHGVEHLFFINPETETFIRVNKISI